jgi:hypothetical protein
MHMNRLMALLLLGGCMTAVAQQTLSDLFVTVVDRSPRNSPIVVSGSGILKDNPEQQARYSGTARLSLLNVSSKSILLIVLRLRANNVPNMDVGRTLDDYFFSSELLEPGGTKISEVSWPEFDEEGERKQRLRGAVRPTINASLLFVQFSDGSTLGNRQKAQEALAARQHTIERLAELESVYRAEGEKSFLDNLAKPTELAKIQHLQEFSEHTNDKSKVIDVLLRLRASADAREGMLKTVPRQTAAKAFSPDSSGKKRH